MKKFNWKNKNLLKTFSYTTATENREVMTTVNYLGRDYFKCGTVQAVTFIGNLYEDDNHNKVLTVGISRQHPNDIKCIKEEGYEAATLKAMFEPDIIFNTVPKKITKFNFRQMCKWYIDGMDLEMIKTSQEREIKSLC